MQPVGLKEWEIKFKQNREILPCISRVVELVLSTGCLQVQCTLTVYPEYPGKADVSRGKAARNACNIWYGLHSRQVTFVFDERDNVYSL